MFVVNPKNKITTDDNHCVLMLAILGDNMVKANFGWFNNNIAGLGVKDGMPLQGTVKGGSSQ